VFGNDRDASRSQAAGACGARCATATPGTSAIISASRISSPLHIDEVMPTFRRGTEISASSRSDNGLRTVKSRRVFVGISLALVLIDRNDLGLRRASRRLMRSIK